MFNISVQESPAYLLIVTSGAGTLDPLCAANRFVEEMLQRTGARRVLLDMMALTLLVDDAERKVVITSLLGGMSRLERLAVLVPRSASLGMLLEAARATGTQASEFDDILDAERWLQA
jgi:hypothetical protein